MTSPSDRARQYLLGELDHVERERFEEDYFRDDSQFEALVVAEEALIDDYLDGALTAEVRARFDANLLASSERRQRVEAARELRRVAARRAGPEIARRWSAGWIAVAATLVLLAGASAAALWRSGQLRAEVDGMLAERQQLEDRTAALEREIAAARAGAQGVESALQTERTERQRLEEQLSRLTQTSRVVALALRLDLVRSTDTTPLLDLTPAASLVRFSVDVTGESAAVFSLTLKAADGRQLRQWVNVRADHIGPARVIAVTTPARVLAPGRYELSVFSQSEGEVGRLGDIPFTARGPVR